MLIRSRLSLLWLTMMRCAKWEKIHESRVKEKTFRRKSWNWKTAEDFTTVGHRGQQWPFRNLHLLGIRDNKGRLEIYDCWALGTIASIKKFTTVRYRELHRPLRNLQLFGTKENNDCLRINDC